MCSNCGEPKGKDDICRMRMCVCYRMTKQGGAQTYSIKVYKRAREGVKWDVIASGRSAGGVRSEVGWRGPRNLERPHPGLAPTALSHQMSMDGSSEGGGRQGDLPTRPSNTIDNQCSECIPLRATLTRHEIAPFVSCAGPFANENSRKPDSRKYRRKERMPSMDSVRFANI